VQYGYTASARSDAVGPRFLRITDIVGPRIDWQSVPYCEIPKGDEAKYLLREGDIVIARTGATTGYAKRIGHFSHDSVFASYLVRFRVKNSIDSRYVGLMVESDQYKRFIQTHMGGAAQPNANAQVLGSFPVPLPPILTQRKIAAVLSAYDDLIENNTRRIGILEEMAHMLYREWFVDFRFPGHESVPMVDSALGPIPEAWQVVNFTDIADVLSGGTPSTRVQDYWDGTIPFFTPKDATPTFYATVTEKRITELGLSESNSQLYAPDTVFITARGTVGKIVMPAISMAMNQSCYALRGRDEVSQYFLYLATENRVEHLRKQTGGATFGTIIVDTFHRLHVIKPPPALIEQFTEVVTPAFQLIRSLVLENANLRQTRDLLLPKLISGELDVEDLDIDVVELSA
jgi:type I restriction enzyme S subunit